MIHIRKCVTDDFDGVIFLLRQLWTDKTVNPHLLRPIFERALTSDSIRYYCATDDDRVIGFGSLKFEINLWPEGQLGYVDELVVDSGHRKKGVGRQLLNRLTLVASEHGCCRIELHSAFYRTESHHFYESQGFETRAYVFSKRI
jgi:GNAT superfamily N-acetyltransferase